MAVLAASALMFSACSGTPEGTPTGELVPQNSIPSSSELSDNNTCLLYTSPDIPPTAKIDGIDLVTEGVLTLSRTVDILKDYLNHEADSYYFHKLDEQNGASMIAKMLLEECTDLRCFIGKAINPAHQNPGLPADLSIKMKLIDELCDVVAKLGKNVEKYYF